ncbi:MAG TPA: OmpW family outer membrane protein [Caulobacteraceae bacterium]|jgi:outer membrane protein
MSRTLIALLAAAALCGAAGGASAQVDPQWFVRLGPALVDLDEDATMEAGGAPVPGANVSIESEWTAAVEIGRFVTPNIAVSFTGGFPPKFDVMSAGSLAALGRAGSITGGPMAVTGHYHFNRQGAFQPYVGAGVAFMYVFDTEDGALTNLEVENAAGPAVQVGANYFFNERFGAFADFKKAWFSSESRGNAPAFGGAPVVADVQLDPAVYNAGLIWRF